jgi:hypothetical protein
MTWIILNKNLKPLLGSATLLIIFYPIYPCPKNPWGELVCDHWNFLEFFGKNLWARGAPLLLYLNIAKHAPFKMVVMAFSEIATIIEFLLTHCYVSCKFYFWGKKLQGRHHHPNCVLHNMPKHNSWLQLELNSY